MVHTSELSVGALLYFVGACNVYGVLVRSDGRCDVFDIGPTSDLQPRVAALVSALGDGVAACKRDKEFETFVDGWGGALLPPDLAAAALDVLVVVPHHFLHGVPIHALRLGSSPLALQMGVSYCSSIRLFEHAMDRNPLRIGADAWEFVLSSDETIRPSRGACELACVTYGGDVVTDSPWYGKAAESFAAHFASQVNLNNVERSVTRTVLKLVPTDGVRVVCLVCHGFVDEVSPEMSGLLVASSRYAWGGYTHELSEDISFSISDYPFRFPPADLRVSAANVEVLTALELAVGRSPVTELACLFGCSTARGEPMALDDVASVAYQWLKTGAGTVLASMWELDVGVLASWVPLFLKNWLERRQPKAIAWREAMRSLLDEQPGLPPAQWSVISLLGDWL